jgi:hypothetical protein
VPKKFNYSCILKVQTGGVSPMRIISLWLELEIRSKNQKSPGISRQG